MVKFFKIIEKIVWAIVYFTSNYQTEIDIKTGMLVSLVDAQKEECAVSQNENAQNQKLDAIIETVKKIPQTDTDAILAVLQKRIPEVVQTLVDKQVVKGWCGSGHRTLA